MWTRTKALKTFIFEALSIDAAGSHIVNERIVPARVDPDDGWKVINQTDYIHKFRCGCWPRLQTRSLCFHSVLLRGQRTARDSDVKMPAVWLEPSFGRSSTVNVVTCSSECIV